MAHVTTLRRKFQLCKLSHGDQQGNLVVPPIYPNTASFPFPQMLEPSFASHNGSFCNTDSESWYTVTKMSNCAGRTQYCYGVHIN